MSVWASLKFPSAADPALIESALGEWFNTRFAGCGLLFEEHVTLYALDHEKEWHYDARLINPYQDLLFLFYRMDRGRIHVMGTINGLALLERKGWIVEAEMQHTVAVPMRPAQQSPPTASSTSMSLSDHLFYFPTRAWVERPFCELQHATHNRITWLLQCADAHDPTLAPVKDFSAQDYAAGMVGMDLVMHACTRLQMPQKQMDFDKMRLECEYYAFMKRFAKFRSEWDVFALFHYNALRDPLIQSGALLTGGDMHPLDLQYFWREYGQDLAPPTMLYSVPVEEVPHQLALKLPLHFNGHVHLAYPDVVHWVWNCHLIHKQRLAVLWPPQATLPAWACEEARRILLHEPEQKLDSKRQRPAAGAAQKGDPQAGWRVDVHELLACLPPCMRNAVENHFPKNRERMTLIPSLSAAGVSLDSATALFANVNDRHPNGSTLEARFNIKSLWERAWNATSCKSIIQKTHLQEAEAVHCPYVSQTESTSTRDNCRACKNEAEMPDMEDMYAPHLFLKWKLQQERPKEDMPKKQKIEEKENSSSEDSVFG